MEARVDVTKMERLIMTVAPTGNLRGKAQNPALPEQPDEIAQCALDCYNAGASICHIHARGIDGKTTGDLAIYSEILSKIKAKCSIITQVGGGIGRVNNPDGSAKRATLEHRLKLTELDPKPDMLTISGGSFEFGWSGSTFENPLSFNEKFIQKCNERKISIECEVFDLSHIDNVLELVRRGILKRPLHFSFVMGVRGCIPATPKALISMLDMIPEDSTWHVVTTANLQLPLTLMAISMGAEGRTGFEDGIHYSRGVLAKSNAQLVERMVKMAKELGREIASVDDAKNRMAISR